MQADSWASQGSIISFWAACSLEASLICILRATGAQMSFVACGLDSFTFFLDPPVSVPTGSQCSRLEMSL
jgi:hypothetical protein